MTTHLPGSFFLTKVPGPSGYLINLGQALAGDGSRWSHAGIVLDTDGTVLEAEPGGARLANLSEYAGRPLLVSDAPVQQAINRSAWAASHAATLWPEDRTAVESAARRAVVREARNLVGVPYSALDYAALAALHLHLPSKAIRDRVESSGHLICSALVDRVYMNAGIHLFNDKPYKLAPNTPRYVGDVMPADLADYAEDWATANA